MGKGILVVWTAALLAATLCASRWSDYRKAAALAAPLDQLPRQVGPWTAAPDSSLSAHVLGELRPTSYLARAYHGPDGKLEFFVAYYSQQKTGVSMHSPKNCLPGGGWEVWQSATMEVETLDHRIVTVNRYHIQNGSDRQVALYWYQTPNRVFASEYLGKLLLVRDALVSGDTSAAIVRITLPDHPGAAGQAVRFAARIIPEVARCIR